MNDARPLRLLPGALLLALLSLLPHAGLAAEATPLEVVASTVDAVIVLLRREDLSEASRRREVRTLIGRHFDFTAMANRVLATNWRKASRDERARFTALFRELLTNTYWARISGYTDERVEYRGERRSGEGLATVNTLIHTATTTIPVDYKLYRRDGRWYAYDVVIEQVSLVRNYRSNFQDIVRKDGIAGLLGQLETKVATSAAVE